MLEIYREAINNKNESTPFSHCMASCNSQCKSIASSPVVEFQALNIRDFDLNQTSNFNIVMKLKKWIDNEMMIITPVEDRIRNFHFSVPARFVAGTLEKWKN